IHPMSEAHGVRGLSGDGNVADEVWRLANYAVDMARGCGGPTLMKSATCRVWLAQETFDSGSEKTIRWYLENCWWKRLRQDNDWQCLGMISPHKAAAT